MRPLIMFGLLLSYACADAANAEQCWIAYEGNDFPENEGWRRIYGNEDGYAGNLCLTLRSRAG